MCPRVQKTTATWWNANHMRKRSLLNFILYGTSYLAPLRLPPLGLVKYMVSYTVYRAKKLLVGRF